MPAAVAGNNNPVFRTSKDMDKFAKNNGYKKVQGEKIQGQQVYFKALQS
jgi:hypothetical protein